MTTKLTYDEDYFSGAQVGIFIGGIWVSDIKAISFSVNQAKQPIYGYASEFFDAVARGRTLVEGNFTINFKSSAYLYIIMKHLQNKIDAADGTLHSAKTIEDFLQNKDKTTIRELSFGALDLFGNQPANQLVNDQASAGTTFIPGLTAAMNTAVDNPNRVSGTFRNKPGIVADTSLLDQEFETLASGFEKQIWGTEKNNVLSQSRSRPDQIQPRFDILITYGDVFQPDPVQVNKTVKKIVSVQLTGSRQIVSISGEPIEETYSFFARNLE